MSRASLGAKILPVKATGYPVKGKTEAPMPAEVSTTLEEGAAAILEGTAVGKATDQPVKGKAEAPMSAEAATILEEGAAAEPEGVDSKLGVSL